MSLLEAVALGALQGTTEFLPVSSSGHLSLAEMLFGGLGAGERLAMDVALHAATLAAVFVYFGRAWAAKYLRRRYAAPVLLAALPAAALYLAAGERCIARAKTSLIALGAAFIAGGAVILFASVRTRNRGRRAAPGPSGAGGEAAAGYPPGPRRALAIGAAQALALFPGLSRSGMTISAGLLGRLSPAEAFEFSFLAGAPLMLGALLVKLGDVRELARAAGPELFAGGAVAFGAGLGALFLLRHAVVRGRLAPFGLYTAGLGAALLILRACGGGKA